MCLKLGEPGLVSIAESARKFIRKSCEVDLVTLAYHTSTKEAEAGEQQVQGQPGILTKILASINKQQCEKPTVEMAPPSLPSH